MPSQRQLQLLSPSLPMLRAPSPSPSPSQQPQERQSEKRKQKQKRNEKKTKKKNEKSKKSTFSKRLSRIIRSGGGGIGPRSTISAIDTNVIDRLETCAKLSGKLRTRDGTKLFFRQYTMTDTPKANIVLLHSFGEHSGMYEHVCKRLMNSAFCVIAFDQRGYGQSEGKRGHISSFDKVLTDISDIVELCVLHRGVPTFLYGQSSGGTAAIQFALRLKEEEEREATSHATAASDHTATASNETVDEHAEPNGEDVPSLSITTKMSPRSNRKKSKVYRLAPIDGIIVTAPYLKLTVDSPSWQKKIIQLISKAYKGYVVQADISVFKLTRDKAMQHAIKEDIFRTPDITVKQLIEWEKRGVDAMCRAKQVDIPILLMHGTQDPVTDHRATHQFFKNCASEDKELATIPHFLHNIHMEIDRERMVFSRIVRWLNKHVGRAESPATPASSEASEVRSTSLHDSDDDSIFHCSSVSSGMLRRGLPRENQSHGMGTVISSSRHRPFHRGQSKSYNEGQKHGILKRWDSQHLL